jgi:hypothetical protein
MSDPIALGLRGNERLVAVAEILAVGVLRLHARAALPNAEISTNTPKPSAEGLEVPVETRLSVRVG